MAIACDTCTMPTELASRRSTARPGHVDCRATSKLADIAAKGPDCCARHLEGVPAARSNSSSPGRRSVSSASSRQPSYSPPPVICGHGRAVELADADERHEPLPLAARPRVGILPTRLALRRASRPRADLGRAQGPLAAAARVGDHRLPRRRCRRARDRRTQRDRRGAASPRAPVQAGEPATLRHSLRRTAVGEVGR